ncbi:hypothetical protein JX266_006482 [Neoarthrinium moseri]|nr:hypothetical protein JX266_006482 [Neoarthrinium moseri]
MSSSAPNPYKGSKRSRQRPHVDHHDKTSEGTLPKKRRQDEARPLLPPPQHQTLLLSPVYHDTRASCLGYRDPTDLSWLPRFETLIKLRIPARCKDEQRTTFRIVVPICAVLADAQVPDPPPNIAFRRTEAQPDLPSPEAIQAHKLAHDQVDRARKLARHMQAKYHNRPFDSLQNADHCIFTDRNSFFAMPKNVRGGPYYGFPLWYAGSSRLHILAALDFPDLPRREAHDEDQILHFWQTVTVLLPTKRLPRALAAARDVIDKWAAGGPEPTPWVCPSSPVAGRSDPSQVHAGDRHVCPGCRNCWSCTAFSFPSGEDSGLGYCFDCTKHRGTGKWSGDGVRPLREALGGGSSDIERLLQLHAGGWDSPLRRSAIKAGHFTAADWKRRVVDSLCHQVEMLGLRDAWTGKLVPVKGRSMPPSRVQEGVGEKSALEPRHPSAAVIDAIYPVAIWQPKPGVHVVGNHFPTVVAITSQALNEWHGTAPVLQLLALRDARSPDRVHSAINAMANIHAVTSTYLTSARRAASTGECDASLRAVVKEMQAAYDTGVLSAAAVDRLTARDVKRLFRFASVPTSGARPIPEVDHSYLIRGVEAIARLYRVDDTTVTIAGADGQPFPWIFVASPAIESYLLRSLTWHDFACWLEGVGAWYGVTTSQRYVMFFAIAHIVLRDRGRDRAGIPLVPFTNWANKLCLTRRRGRGRVRFGYISDRPKDPVNDFDVDGCDIVPLAVVASRVIGRGVGLDQLPRWAASLSDVQEGPDHLRPAPGFFERPKALMEKVRRLST